MNSIKIKNEQINLFKLLLNKSFGRRLVGIIGYGSFFVKPETAQDIDIIIVLDKKNKRDLQKIRKSYEHSLSPIKIQSQIIYKDKILSNGNFYSINTCGPFFIEVIRKDGVVIYGKNIFTKIKNQKTILYKISILQKIQQYIYQLKNFYLNSNRISNKKEIEHFILKKMKCLLVDIGLFSNQLGHKNIRGRIVQFINKTPQTNNDRRFLEAIDLVEEVLFALTSYFHTYYNVKYID